jgi:CheY-like chemotaxis protein
MAEKRILVIDDSEFILESTSTLLQFEGYEIFTASNGEDGIAVAKKELPDLIICDVSMPGMSGYEVVTEIRASKETQGIPFIFLTAFTEKSKMREGMEKGADDYITKPFTKKEIVSAINSQWKKTTNVETKIQKRVETIGKNLNYALPHEFYTAFTQILNSANFLKNDIENLDKKETSELAGDIVVAVNRLKRITDDFILFVKLENCLNSPEEIEKYRAEKTVEPCVTCGDIATTISEKYERSEDMELLEIVSDITIKIGSDLFYKLVDEIVDNAFKFSEKGTKVTINTKLANDKFAVEITDRGIGMTRDEINNIGAYMQFQREKFEQQGVGIGLIIAKRIVEIHGGDFEIKSEKELGTTVSFSIPLN